MRSNIPYHLWSSMQWIWTKLRYIGEGEKHIEMLFDINTFNLLIGIIILNLVWRGPIRINQQQNTEGACHMFFNCTSTVHWLSRSMHVVWIPTTRIILPSLKTSELKLLLSDPKFMNTCSFTTHLKKTSACSKMLVE